MSRKNYVTEREVKKALRIDSFRNLSKDKIMEFASMIPRMDKDVAISIINQFPAFAGSALNMIQQFKSMCDSAIEANTCSNLESMKACKLTLEKLGERLNRDDISPEERAHITEEMVDLAKRMLEKDSENKAFLLNVVKTTSTLISGAILIGSVVLGVNTKGIKLPSIRS